MFLTFLKPVLIIIGVLVIFNLMIIVHELGHFLAARWRGLVIEKFGIWFGKPIWKKKINGVEYSLGCIPAGGFVALPQLAPMEVMEGQTETPRDQLPPISALDKIIVAFAGPLFSFLLAFVFAVIVWHYGKPERETETSLVIGMVEKGSRAEDAGVKVGDKIIAVDDHAVSRFGGMGADSVMWRIVRSEGDAIKLLIEREENGQIVRKDLYPRPKEPTKANWWNRKGLRQIGIAPSISAVVSKVTADTPAAKAGLKEHDIITAVNGQKLYEPDDIYDYAAKNPGKPLELTVLRGPSDDKMTEQKLAFDPSGVKVREVLKSSPAADGGLQKGDIILSMDGEKVPVVKSVLDYVGARADKPIKIQIRRGSEEKELTVTPQVPEGTGSAEERAELASKGRIGTVLDEDDGLGFLGTGRYRVITPGPTPWAQLKSGVMSIVNTLDAVISPKSHVSVQHMGGPVMMMNAYYTILSGPEGPLMAIWFSVILNVNLAMLNLLPIPVLDGGHITLAIIEAIRRKPVNVRLLEYVQTACALTIIGFMVFIAFFDVQDLPFMGGKQSTMQFRKATTAESPK